MFSFGSGWNPTGKRVLITGGSQGLGLSLASLLVSQGADVVICARNSSKLDSALEKLEKGRLSETQRIKAISADVSNFEGAKVAVDSCEAAPEAVFCCAGGAKPGFFIEQTQEDFEIGLKTIYWTALSTAHAAANAMARSGVQDGKIILVSSTLGFMGLIGYAQYTPMKHAIRGLAESLRSELQLYSISVHAYFPGTIYSPGFEEEQKTKPAITKQIEGAVEGLTPEQCAKGLLKGIQRGNFIITTDFETDLFRVVMSGAGPGNVWLLDLIKCWIASIALPIWRVFTADSAIRSHRVSHLRELKLPTREGKEKAT